MRNFKPAAAKWRRQIVPDLASEGGAMPPFESNRFSILDVYPIIDIKECRLQDSFVFGVESCGSPEITRLLRQIKNRAGQTITQDSLAFAQNYFELLIVNVKIKNVKMPRKTNRRVPAKEKLRFKLKQ